MKIRPAIAKPTILLLTALILFFLPGLKFGHLDRNADDYFAEAMTKAGSAYGVCRVVNAAVSVIKESQIQVEPAGLGVSLAAGQILDPLDDMTERASDILITAIVSLGIQKVAYDLSVMFTPPVIAICLIAVVISFMLKAKRFRESIIKSMLLIVVARLCLPTSAVVSSILYDKYFSEEISKTKDALSMSSPEVERLKDMQMPQVDGVMGTIRNGFSFVGGKITDLKEALKTMVNNAGNMVSNLLKLSYLYVALFVSQVILLPIGAFWLITRITNGLFGTRIPFIFRHRDVGSSSGRGDHREIAQSGSPD